MKAIYIIMEGLGQAEDHLLDQLFSFISSLKSYDSLIDDNHYLQTNSTFQDLFHQPFVTDLILLYLYS